MIEYEDVVLSEEYREEDNSHGGRFFGSLVLAGALVVSACSGGGGAEADSSSETEGIATTESVSSTHEDGADAREGREVDVYLETWLTDEDYTRISDVLGSAAVDGLSIAFAEPTVEGEISFEESSEAFARLLGELSPEKEISLSIGGWGENDEEHEELGLAWQAALDNPEAFSENVASLVDSMNLEGIDLDFEFPTAEQADDLVELVRVLRDRLGEEIQITMAVSAEAYTDGYRFGEGGLQEYVDVFRVMTYDYSGPSWSEVAGDIAPGDWVVGNIAKWANWVGGPDRLSVGYPTYGYLFAGAEGIGSEFNPDASGTVQYLEVDGSTVVDDMRGLSSGALTSEGWVSLMSPEVISEVHQRVLDEVGEVDGAFYWSGEGISAEHIDAVSAN